MEKAIITEHGKAVIIEDEDGTRIDSIEIIESSRRMGHGRDLLIKAIKTASLITTNNKIFIVADSKTDDFENADLVEFYENEGFSVVDCNAACVVMEMDI